MGILSDYIGKIVIVATEVICPRCNVGKEGISIIGKLVAEDERMIFIKPVANFPKNDLLMQRRVLEGVIKEEKDHDLIDMNGRFFPKDRVTIKPIG